MAATADTSRPDKVESLEWLEIVRAKVQGLRFGAVQLVVHEGRVTQIDRTERTRLSHASEPSANDPERP